MGGINDAKLLGHLSGGCDIYSNLDADSCTCGKKGFAMTDVHTPGLLPCPFCGGEAELIEGEECAYVQCLQVKCHRGPLVDGDNAAADEAVAEWNRRAPASPDLLAALDDIARQKTSCQIERTGETEFSDFEGAYDMCIEVARAAIAKAKGVGL